MTMTDQQAESELLRRERDKFWRWCYRAVLALAKEQMRDSGDQNGWEHRSSSTHHFFIQEARRVADIPDAEFRHVIEDYSGTLSQIAGEEYARACRCSSCREEYPEIFIGNL